MLSPNLALILFSEQWFTAYGLFFILNSVQSADISTLTNARSKNFFVHITQFYLDRPESVWNYPTRIRPAFLRPDTTLMYAEVVKWVLYDFLHLRILFSTKSAYQPSLAVLGLSSALMNHPNLRKLCTYSVSCTMGSSTSNLASVPG